MERRLASFLFRDQDDLTFMDSESFDQYTFSRDVANLAQLDLRDGCEVFLSFDREENLIEVELAEPSEGERLFHELYQSVTRERFVADSLKVLHQRPAQLRHIDMIDPGSHRAIYVYRRDPIALVVEFGDAEITYRAYSKKRVPLADLVRESPSPALWQSIFDPQTRPYHGPYGEQAEAAYQAIFG